MSSTTTTIPAGRVFTRETTYAAVANQKPIRYGILGTGRIAEDFALALQPCKDIVLQAVGSRTQASAEKFGEFFRIPGRYGSYEEVVKDPEVEVVWIGTPDAYHAEHALLAIAHGKHVLVEKPFTETVADAEKVFAAARAKGVFCMEGLWTRFVPATEKVLEIIRAGILGDIKLVSLDFGIQFDIPSGALNSVGCYNFAFTQIIYDLQSKSQEPVVPSKLFAVGSLVADGTTDNQVAAVVQYGPQQLATFSASIIANTHKEALIVGTKGRIRLLGPLWHSTTKFILEVNNEAEQVFSFEKIEAYDQFLKPFNILNSERLIYEALEVNRCIREKLLESPHWRHGQTLQVMKNMAEVRKQIRA